ncbi:O-succinylhomoserine sulfhydrylase [Zea mays]|nr:O-succinylhomoserine sulfhydrylase [Zea mays]
MAQTLSAASELATLKRPFGNDGFGDGSNNGSATGEKPKARRREADPAAALAAARHEFGEHGGVNMSIEASATFTVMEPDTTPTHHLKQAADRDGPEAANNHHRKH